MRASVKREHTPTTLLLSGNGEVGETSKTLYTHHNTTRTNTHRNTGSPVMRGGTDDELKRIKINNNLRPKLKTAKNSRGEEQFPLTIF